jgi:hypothetical protein
MANQTAQGGKIFWLAYLAVSVWVVLFLVVNNQADMDLWGVMSFGALLDQNLGRFPYVDPFSYTAKGAPWVYHEWGSGVVFYQFFKYGGSQALFWVKLLLVEVMLVLSCHLYLLGGLRKAIAPINRYSETFYALCLPWVVYLLLPNMSTTVRCHLFTFVGFALFLYLLKRHSQGRLKYGIWLLPLVMILWANLHGGFIMGLGLLGAYLLYHWFSNHKHETEIVAIVLFLSALATITNPYGLRFWETMVSAWALPREHITEWGNVTTLAIPFYGLLYTALYLLSLGLGYIQWRRTKETFPLTLILLFFTGAYGWLHYKLAPLFLIALLSHGFDHLTEDLAALRLLLPAKGSGLKKIADCLFPAMAVWWPTVLLVFGLFLGGFYWRTHADPLAVRVPGIQTLRSENTATQFSYPLGVTGYILRHQIHGNLWVPFSWGEFMYWVLYPQCHVSIDGRYETLYSAQIFNAYHRFYHPPYPVQEAERYPTTYIVVESWRPVLVQKLRQSKRWHEVYRDAQSVLFSRHASPLEIGHPALLNATLDHYRGNLDRFKALVDF